MATSDFIIPTIFEDPLTKAVFTTRRGGVSKAGQILIDTVQKHFVAAAFHASEGAEFALAKLGNDAGMYGAVKMVL